MQDKEVAQGRSSFSQYPKDQLITLTIGQLQDLIKQAVAQAIEPLQERVDTLEIKIDELEALQEMYHGPVPSELDNPELGPALRDAFQKRAQALQELPSRVLSLEMNLEDLQASTRKGEPEPINLERADKIVKYLHNRPDHRATYTTLKGLLRLADNELSAAISALNYKWPGKYQIRKDPTDKRKRILIEMPKNTSG